MKYIVSEVKKPITPQDARECGMPSPIETEDQAIQIAKESTLKTNKEYGVYKLIKKTSPPDPLVTEVE